MCCCCSNCKDERNTSEFQCSPCRYRNGLVPLLVAQMLIVVASIFSIFSAWDCHFVTVNASYVADTLDEIVQLSDNFDNMTLVATNTTTRGLGFLLWEGIDGKCTPRDTNYTEEMYELYSDFLGSDWNAPRIMAIWTILVAFCLMTWIFIFSCFAQPKILRNEVAFFSIVLLPIFQSITFMTLNSDFCKKYDCSMGRSAKYAAGAISLYALTGVAFLFTHTYPAPVTQHSVDAVQADLEQQTIPTKVDETNESQADKTLQDVSQVDESQEILPLAEVIVN